VSTLIYAIGGGLGHFTRSLAVVHTLRAQLPGPCTVLVSPGVAKNAAPCLDSMLAVRELPMDAVKSPECTLQWVRQELAELKPETLVVDCFPLGLFGELPPVLDAFAGPRIHVARALKSIPGIREGTRRPLYDLIYTVESCQHDQMECLRRLGRELRPLELSYPSAHAPAPPADLGQSVLVVHSGDDRENRLLLDLARTAFPEWPPLLVTAERPAHDLPPPARWLPAYPAWPWFSTAAAVVSACGFNTMEQMRGLSTPHAFLPMPRRFDDQHRRARLRSRS